VKKKVMFKIMIDIVMTVLLLFLMARQITGDTAHEWLGASMFILWITHNVLNIKWYSHLFKGKYTLYRIVQSIINSLLLLSMVGTMVSGVILSREVFAFLPVSGGTAIARSLHILSVYWCFVLTALHLGLHWNMIIGMIRKATGSASSKTALVFLRIVAAAIAIYGFSAFIKNQLLSYMLMTSSFVFFDFEKPVPLFFIEYIAIMGLFVFLAHYGFKGVQRITRRKTSVA